MSNPEAELTRKIIGNTVGGGLAASTALSLIMVSKASKRVKLEEHSHDGPSDLHTISEQPTVHLGAVKHLVDEQYRGASPQQNTLQRAQRRLFDTLRNPTQNLGI